MRGVMGWLRGRGIPPRKSLRGIPAAALLVLPLLFGFATTAEAQTTVTLVSNTNAGTARTGDQLSPTWRLAQGFTTGASSRGYKVSSLEIRYTTAYPAGHLDDLTVTLRNADGANPGNTVLGTFTNPSPSNSAGLATFTAPGSGIDLAASTTYFIQFSLASGATAASYQPRSQGTEDSASQDGWSIANGARRYAGSWQTRTVLQIHLRGTVTPTSTGPAAPANLRAAPENEGVQLQWRDPSDNTITKWQYRRRDGDPGTWGAWTDLTTSKLGSILFGTVRGLTNGTEYDFEVRAVAGSTNGTAATVSATPVPRPEAPTGLTATGGNQQVVLRWTDPSNASITGYAYQQRTPPSTGTWGNEMAITPSGATTTTHTVTGLTNYTEYEFRLRAINPAGGTNSDAVSATPRPANAPGPPTNFTAVAGPGGGQVTLSWTRPSGTITRQEYRVRSPGGNWFGWANMKSATITTFVAPVGNEPLEFQMRARNGRVFGVLSAIVPATAVAAPAAPTSVTATAGDAQVTLGWADPSNSNITKYQYRQRTPPGGGSWGSWTDFTGGTTATSTGGTVTGLTNGTAYQFQVRATAATGGTVLGAASTAVTATPAAVTTPAAPTGFTIDTGDTEITLKWTDPGNDAITKYQYRQGTGPVGSITWSDWTDIPNSDEDTTEYTVTGLTNGTRYYFEVRAVAGTVLGTATASTAITPVDKPAAPTSLTATVGATQVTLNWADPGNATITKYQVRYGAGLSTDSGFSWGTWADVSSSSATTTSATVTGLTNGTEYTFGVRAVGLSGDGAEATVVATPLATNAPAAPASFRRQLGEEQITLTWADPSNNAITKWQYRQGTGTPLTWGAWMDIPSSNAGTTSHTVTGLTAGTRYRFQVRAVAGTVFGAATAALSGIPERPPPVAPVLTATAGDARVTLTWLDPGDASITRGGYQVRTAGTGTWSANRSIPGIAFTRFRSISVTQASDGTTLVNGTDYEFRMRFQRGSTAQGIWSNRVTATPLAAGAAAAPTGFTATAGSGQVALAWTAPSGTITKYQVRQGTGDPVVWGAWTDITGTTSHTVTDLTGGTAYSFQVRAVTGTSVLGAMSDTASATPTAPPPGVPGNVAAAAGDTQVTLSWTAPGGTITGYEYQQRVEGTLWPDGWTSIENSASLTEYAVTGLTNGTTYEFHLAAVNTSGSGAPSAAVSATPLASGAPVAPTGLTATAGGSSVTLSWTAPGGTITGYEIRQGTGDPVDWGAWGAISGSDANTTSTTVSSLTVGTAYSFQIRAVNNAVKGAMSDTVSATPAAATVGFKNAILTSTENKNLTVTLVLSQAVSADVDIYLTSTDFTATKGSDYAAGNVTSPDSTTGTYEVTITAGQTEGSTTIAITDDTIPEVNELFQLGIHEIASTVAIARGTPTTLEVIIRGDTDTAIALPDPATLTVTEASGSTRTGTYNVALQVEPNATETVTVAVASQDASVATVTPASLTFTADDWNTGQTVTVTGVDDEIDQDTDRTVAIRHTATSDSMNSLYTGRDSADLIVTVTDDDVTAPGVTISVTDATVSEADQTDTATFTVVLNTEPSSGLVVVSVDASGAPGLELDGPDAPTAFSNAEVLTFTTTNWNSPRTIRVRATSEATDNPSGREETITWTATATADTDYQNLTGDAATVTVVDNDPTTVTLAGAAGDVAEGATKTFTVTLGRGLVDGETLGVPLTFGGDATRGTDYMTACPTTLPTGVTCNDLDDTSLTPTVTFTGPTSGATARTVTLTLSAASDNTTEAGGETVIIGLGTLNASSGTGLEGGASGTDSLADFKITDPDASVPTVAITGIPAKINNTNALTATFTFSEAVTGFEKADITVTGGTAGTFSATSTTVYTLGITPDGDANVVVTVAANSATDGTNMGPASAESATAVWDETAPTVEITGVPGKISNRDAFTVTFSFSETVTGFDTDDVSVTNGDKSAFSGSGSSYTVVVTPNADADVTVTVAAGGATDGLNTGPANAVSATAVWDETAPTVDITGIPAKINNTNALTATFTFSETVTGFAKSDITVTGGTAGAFGGSGTTYTLAITPTSGSNVVVTVAANSATDGTNMGPASAETATATWDASVPTVGITGVPARISGTSDLTATFTFSEDVTGFVKNDITVTGGTAGTFTATSARVYTLVITPDGDANVVVTVTADSATDGLNMGPASAETATAVWTALVFNPAAVTVVEEASATYTVELSSQPDGNVTVTVSGASGEVTFDTDSTTPGTQTTALTFTTTTWDDAQTVTVLAAADGDTANDSATLTHTASGGGYGSVTGDVEVTVTDNDTPGLVLDPTSLTVAEGGSGTYTVALATQPTASVTVTVAGASGEVTFDTDGDTGGNQNTLTFTTSDWGTAQTVTVSAGQDNDADDDSATLTHSASGGGYGSVSGSVAVTVTDDDTASVVTTEPDATATEGSTTDEATFTVALNTRPSSDVTVTVTAPTGLTLDGPDSATTFTSSEGLTFTSTNWSTAQTVTVRATDDNDDSPIGRELTVTYAVTSSDSGYSGLSGDAATVTVVDNDPTTVTLAGTAGDVVEGGTKTFTVTLGRGLVNGETLPVPLTFGGDATRGTDYTTACPTTLPTGVTCANLDSGTPTVTFTGPSTGATVTTVTLTLTATTDNTAEAGGESVVIGLGTLNASSGTGLGGGASGTDSLADFDITDPDASAPTLEISGVPKRITTRAAFTVTFTFSESVTGFVTGDVTVTNGDKSSFTGSGSSYTVVVTPNADADVTVTVDADSATDGTNTGPPADVVATAVFGAPAAPASLSATAGNAAVTLSWTDPGDDTITGYEFRQGVQSSPVTWGSWTPITNSDKDTTSHTVTGLTDGTEYYFQVRAVSDAVMGEPSAEENRDAVVTPVAVNAPAAPTGLGATAGNGQVALSWTASSSNGITKHQVRSGSGDPLVWGSWTDIANSASITSHTVTGLTNGTEYSFQVRAVATAVLGVTSDTAVATPRGAAGVTTTQPSDRQVTEGDTSDTATFTVELDTQPSSDVTLTVEAVAGLELDGPDGATAFTASEALTFTSSNWGTAQTVTVRATDDSVDRSSGGALTVSYSIASSDSGYNLLFGVAALVTVTDNDPTAVTLAGAAGDITEGETKDFTVTLGVRGLVSGETLGVPLTFTGGATRGTDYTTACPSSLPTGVTCNDLNTAATPTVTFTGPSTGETARTVTLTLSAATDNTAETGGETVMIGLGTLTATGLEGGASGTDSLADFRITDPSATDTTVPTLSISGVPGTISTRTAFTANFTFSESVTDFDTNDITVTGGSKDTLTGSGRSYRMRITPTGGVNVVVTVRRNAATDGTNRGPAAAVSRTATWRAPSPPPQQPPAEEDDDPPSSGGGGGGGGSTPSLPSASLSAVSVSAGQMVIEGGEALFRITASPVPSDEITVRVRVSATGDFVDGVQLGERLVTLSASAPTASLRVATIDDRRNEADGTVTVTVLSGEDYRLSQASASLAVTDDDTPALVLTPETLTVDEGGSGNYRVALATEPAGDVTVSIAGTGEVTTAQNTLTFTAGNWSTAQPVTVSAGQDADAADDRARLDHRASGGGYDSVTGSVAVTVMDDDTPGLILTPAALTLAEGASASYTVALATEPTGNVTVSIAGTGDVTVDRSTLSFTARNWSAAQTVTAFAARDEDVANDSATLAHHARGGDYSSVTGSVEVTVTDAGAAVVSAHLARFGRTVAEQALDGIAGRLRAPRTAGMQKTLAGPRLNVPREGDTAQGTMHAEARRTGFENEYESQSRDLLHLPNAREMLLGSSFTLTTQEAEGTGGSFAFWGRASANRFDGATNDGATAIGLDGEVLTGLVGADYARGDWLFGLALTHSLSEGGYTSEGASGGKVDASLTAALPYASIQANPRLKLWGAGGYGIGEVTLKTGGASYRADTDWTMAAAGVRGDLLDAAGNRPAVAVIGDGLWMRSTSDEIAALSTADTFVTRLRLGVEASYDFNFDGMGDLTPRVEAGARHDGGDAETGAGMDLGVGINWKAPVFGLSLDVAGRMLILHENEDFADRGISAAVVFDPSPESERGPSLSLRQAIGGSADGGIEALFATTTPLGDGGQIGSGAGMRRTLETAYGFSAFGGRFTASPHAEVDFTERARDYALGWRFVPHELASDLAFGIKATRREAETLAPVHVFGVEATVRW